MPVQSDKIKLMYKTGVEKFFSTYYTKSNKVLN